jgi:murein hydrolase activator
MNFLCTKPFLVFLLVCCSWVLTNAQQKQPEKVILAQNNFENLKGCLPWPADNFKELITYKQARENVRIQFGVKAPNHKILAIRYDKATTIKAIAEGSVHSVFDVENSWTVMVKHGDYWLVYSNLDTVYLKKGDSICIMQPIGKITSPTANNYYELEMLLYRNKKELDPYEWLKPMEKSQPMYKLAERL